MYSLETIDNDDDNKTSLNVCEKKDKNYDLNKLKDITGIGPSHAKKLIQKGINFQKLYDELKTNINFEKSVYLKELTKQQYIGLKYYDDLKIFIPRQEIKQFQPIFKNILETISKNIDFVFCGSFRRKIEKSNEIDILLTNSDLKVNDDLEKYNYLSKIINELKNNSILIDDLTTSTTRYSGICKINNIARRIDIRIVLYKSYIPSIVNFTGSWQHNINLRNIAMKQHYKLNEYGLFKINGNKYDEILLKSEKDLYENLGLEYILPKDR